MPTGDTCYFSARPPSIWFRDLHCVWHLLLPPHRAAHPSIHTHAIAQQYTWKIQMNFFDAHGRYLLFFSEATIDMVSRSPLRVTPTSTASSSGSSFINTCTPFNWFRWIKSLWHLRIYQGTFHDISTRYIHQWSFRSKCTTFPFLTSTTQSRLCSQSHFITVVFMDGGTTISPLVTRQAMNWSPIISELRQLAL